MRNLSLFMLAYSAFLTTGFCQEVMVSTDTLERGVGKEKYRYQSFDQFDQRFMMKMGITAGPGTFLGDPFDLFVVEYKLTKSFSIEGAYYYDAVDHSLSSKVRHYLNREGLANNMSGKYLAIEYSKTWQDTEFLIDPNFAEDQALFLQFGNQIKKSQFGYADFLVYASYRFGHTGNSVGLGLNVVFGPSWGPVGKRSDSKSRSFTLREERTLLTIENPSLVVGEALNSLALSASVERELFIRGLTSRTQVSVRYSDQDHLFRVRQEQFFSITQEFRKYFGLMKKPATDRPLRSFSGIYGGLGIGDVYIDRNLEEVNDAGEKVNTDFKGLEQLVPYLSIGYQERMGNRHFLDMFIRYEYLYSTNRGYGTRKDGPLISLGARVGLSWGR